MNQLQDWWQRLADPPQQEEDLEPVSFYQDTLVSGAQQLLSNPNPKPQPSAAPTSYLYAPNDPTITTTAMPFKPPHQEPLQQESQPLLIITMQRPKRSLNCYNFFFAHHRLEIYQNLSDGAGQGRNNGRIGFKGLATMIAQRWKNITASEKAHFERLAKADKIRFQREMKVFQQAKQDA